MEVCYVHDFWRDIVFSKYMKFNRRFYYYIKGVGIIILAWEIIW
jgi:hypothetical protein